MKDIFSVDQERAKITMGSRSRISLNGTDFVGNNIIVNGDQVFIDGNAVDFPSLKQIKIEIYGDCDRVDTTSGDVRVSGGAGDVKTVSGDVSVTSGSVSGNVSTVSGDITCMGGIAGSAKTVSGDIISKKFV